MKTRPLFVMLMLAFSLWNCSDHPDSSEKAVDEAEKARQAELDSREILVIDQKPYSNLDLKVFFNTQYPDISSTRDSAILSRLFDIFIEQQLILNEIKKDNIDMEKVEITDFVETLQIGEELKSKHFSHKLKIQKYLYFKIYQDITVTDREISNYYNQNKDEFRKNDEVLLHQIFVKDKEKSAQIRGMLKNFPDKFEETARNESEAPEASKDGLMGYYERGTLPKEMEDMVFSLKPNEISPVVETQYGFHIFKVTKKRKERMMYLSAVKEDIKNNILSEKLRVAYEDYMNRLKTRVNLTIRHQNLFFPYFDSKGDSNETDS